MPATSMREMHNQKKQKSTLTSLSQTRRQRQKPEHPIPPPPTPITSNMWREPRTVTTNTNRTEQRTRPRKKKDIGDWSTPHNLPCSLMSSGCASKSPKPQDHTLPHSSLRTRTNRIPWDPTATPKRQKNVREPKRHVESQKVKYRVLIRLRHGSSTASPRPCACHMPVDNA